MKRTLLLVVLLALIGSFAFAVVIRKDNSRNVKVETKEVKKKRTGCGMYY